MQGAPDHVVQVTGAHVVLMRRKRGATVLKYTSDHLKVLSTIKSLFYTCMSIDMHVFPFKET